MSFRTNISYLRMNLSFTTAFDASLQIFYRLRHNSSFPAMSYYTVFVRWNIVRIISNYLNSIPDLSSTDKAKLNYFLSCIVYEGSKIILFVIFFAITQQLKEFLYSMILLLPLRIISGGLHFKHYWACLAFSFGYFYVVTIPLATYIPPYGIALVTLGICILINYRLSPIISDSRPPLSSEAVKRTRLHILTATAYDTILTALFFDTALAPVGFWTIVLHSVQLIIATSRKKRGEKCA